eukprot:1348456-Prymnesium_polylepis.1
MGVSVGRCHMPAVRPGSGLRSSTCFFDSLFFGTIPMQREQLLRLRHRAHDRAEAKHMAKRGVGDARATAWRMPSRHSPFPKR